MKILKLKSILFSLMAITMVTVFLTSCEREKTLPESITNETIDVNDLFNLILPWGYDEEMTLEKKAEYLNSIDNEIRDKLEKSSLIFEYFVSLNKAGVLADNAVYGDIFDESTLSSYLTEEEVTNFHSMTDLNQDIESRWGCDCEKDYDYEKTLCLTFYNHYAGYYKAKVDIYKKECHAWYCPDRIQQRNKRSCN